MSLTTLALVKTFLEIPSTDTSQDSFLSLLVVAADATIKNYCKQNIELANYLEYRDGMGTQDLALFQKPVRAYSLSGTVTQGSAVVTGISSTANLSAGMAAAGNVGNTQAITPGSTIQSITPTTTVTLTQPALVSGTATISFGLAVWFDAGGFYGDGANGFAAQTQLTLGSMYLLRRDLSDGTSKSGVISRMGFGAGAWGAAGFWWGAGGRRGSLSAWLPTVWPTGQGNIKVMYTAGYAAPLPDDLVQAANMVVSWMKRHNTIGGSAPLLGEHLPEYGYTVTPMVLQSIPELGGVRQILSRYRDFAA